MVNMLGCEGVHLMLPHWPNSHVWVSVEGHRTEAGSRAGRMSTIAAKNGHLVETVPLRFETSYHICGPADVDLTSIASPLS